MNLENQQKYVEEVAAIIAEKILSMKNINKDVIDNDSINLLAHKAAEDLLMIGYICHGEFGLFDEFTKEQLNSNVYVGELQAIFKDYCGTQINISRMKLGLVDDLSDLQIQLVNNTGEFIIAVIESKSDKTIQIKNSSKELRFQDGRLRLLDLEHNVMHEFIDVNDISLEKAMQLFNADINSFTSNSLLEDGNGHSII